MTVFAFLLLLLAADARPQFTSPKDPAPQYGNGLTPEEVRAGWITLVADDDTMGWPLVVSVESGGGLRSSSVSGASTSEFGDYDLKVSTSEGGELIVGKQKKVLHVPRGDSTHRVVGAGRGPIELRLSPDSLHLRPLHLSPALHSAGDGRGWRAIPHPSLPRDQLAKWEEIPQMVRATPEPAGLHAVGGPGCVELPGDYGDFILQVTVRTRKPLANAGVFFRCKAGEFLNGYEAQVFNACYDNDPAKPARWATGAIDDRQNARLLVSRDGEPFVMTIIATGPHIATWVNGVQVTDWTDRRKPDDNPRNGLRVKPGPIQLQAHDKDTDVEFSNLRVAPL